MEKLGFKASDVPGVFYSGDASSWYKNKLDPKVFGNLVTCKAGSIQQGKECVSASTFTDALTAAFDSKRSAEYIQTLLKLEQGASAMFPALNEKTPSGRKLMSEGSFIVQDMNFMSQMFASMTASPAKKSPPSSASAPTGDRKLSGSAATLTPKHDKATTTASSYIVMAAMNSLVAAATGEKNMTHRRLMAMDFGKLTTSFGSITSMTTGLHNDDGSFHRTSTIMADSGARFVAPKGLSAVAVAAQKSANANL